MSAGSAADRVAEQAVVAAAADPRVQQAALRAAADPRVQEAGLQVARDQLSRVDWAAKRQQAAGVVRDVSQQIRRGDVSTQSLCFTGGVAMCVCGVLSLVNVASALTTPFQWVFNLYVVAFSVIVLAYECPVHSGQCGWLIACLRVQRVRAWFDEWFKAFSVLIGRGLLYFSIGFLFVLGRGLLDPLGLIGVYMSGCGAFLVWRWHQVSEALDAVRLRLRARYAADERTLVLAFRRAEAAQGGGAEGLGDGLDASGLQRFFEETDNTVLTPDEVNTALHICDANNSGRVELLEFIAWYHERALTQRDEEGERAAERAAAARSGLAASIRRGDPQLLPAGPYGAV